MAIMIVFSYVIFFLPRDYRSIENESNNLLNSIEHDDVFRLCVLTRDRECIDSIIDYRLGDVYSYQYSIYRYVEPENELNMTNVYVYSWFFSGNGTNFDPTIFKLYYWYSN